MLNVQLINGKFIRSKIIKKYYYLAGLNRTGNTLLSSILKQNKDIHIGGLSPLNLYVYSVTKTMENQQLSLISNSRKNSINLINSMFDNFYLEVDKNIIIDREKRWACPEFYHSLKSYIDPKCKIIYTKRPLLEILLSTVTIMPLSILSDMAYYNYNYDLNLTEIDNMCDFLLSNYSGLPYTLSSLKTIEDKKNKNNIHVIEYDDLVNNPENVMNSIYSFLDLDRFTHNFNNIINDEKYNHSILNLPENLHEVRPILSKTSQDPYTFFSDYVINKYGKLKTWNDFETFFNKNNIKYWI
jgi:sulfotransferase